jgi:hypothetical protein
MTHDVMRTKKAIDSFTLARARQVVNHGFTSVNDDKRNGNGQLADAAACYALADSAGRELLKSIWPWSSAWFKPAKSDSIEDRKRDIEKAGALLLAEWERLDRAQEVAEDGGDSVASL